MSQTISQTEKPSFKLFSITLICSVISITLQIKRMSKHAYFLSPPRKKLSYLDHGLSSGILLRKV